MSNTSAGVRTCTYRKTMTHSMQIFSLAS